MNEKHWCPACGKWSDHRSAQCLFVPSAQAPVESQGASQLVRSGNSSAGIPPGCASAPGYILTVFDGAAWLKQDGTVTRVWAERGVWPSEHEAAVALDQFFQPNGEDEPRREKKD